jgi:hypothetical protein
MILFGRNLRKRRNLLNLRKTKIMNLDKGYIRIEDNERKRRKIRASLTTSANHILGICEHIRYIYDSVFEIKDKILKEKITEQLVDALIMGKKMGGRLSYYYKKYNDKSGHKGTNINMLGRNNRRRRMRRERFNVHKV